jgi:type VI secretion system secreted protein Hcp
MRADDDAKQRIRHYGNDGTPKGVWAGIEKKRVIDGLRERIDNEDGLNQHNQNICGPASLVHILLMDNPAGHIGLAIHLYKAGQASWKGAVVQPSMRTSKASPRLMLACAAGEHFPRAVLTVRPAGKEQQGYACRTMTNVLVSHYQISSQTRGDIPRDAVSLHFAKMELEYKEQKAGGSSGAAVKAGWNAKENKAL